MKPVLKTNCNYKFIRLANVHLSLICDIFCHIVQPILDSFYFNLTLKMGLFCNMPLVKIEHIRQKYIFNILPYSTCQV